MVQLMKVNRLIIFLVSTLSLVGCSQTAQNDSNQKSSSNNNQSTISETPVTVNSLTELELPSDYVRYSVRTHDTFDYITYSGRINSCVWGMDDDKKPIDIVTTGKKFFWALNYDKENTEYVNVADYVHEDYDGYGQAYYYLMYANQTATNLPWLNFWDIVYNAKQSNAENTDSIPNPLYWNLSDFQCLKYSDRYELITKDCNVLFGSDAEGITFPTNEYLESVITFSLNGDLIHFKIPEGAWNGGNPYSGQHGHIYQYDLELKRLSTENYKAPTYSISYDLKGGQNNPNNPSSYTFGNSYELLEPSKEGSQFAYWAIDCSTMYPKNSNWVREVANDDGYRQIYDMILSGYSGDLTLTAIWQ